MDIFSRSKRSEIMSRVRGRGNRATELALVSIFRRNRIVGWRRHAALFGKPDFAFGKVRLALFVDGCFWHGCPKHATQPRNNEAFWADKLTRNKARDRLVVRTLRSRGWRVLRIWHHELSVSNERRLLRRLRAAIER
ncbi:MAG: very short patch repair endonuclease [Acidobacteriia bacterium]|nr:very short patch repair endonuclease [Terriglobia bacterium]